MSGGWVAGAVRAEALTRRRLGAAGARRLAGCSSLAEAARELAATPYRHDLPEHPDLAGLQRAAGATVLWHLRVLAGWLPRPGAALLRVLAAGFEIANVEEHVAWLSGLRSEPGYRLGGLETAWTRVERTTTLEEVREVMRRSPWGDAGSTELWRIGLWMRLVWSQHVIAGAPEAAGWARAAAALLLVREVGIRGHLLDGAVATRATSVLGPAFVHELTSGAGPVRLAAALPGGSRWALDGMADRSDLWRAEAAWHRHVERDGFRLLSTSQFDRAVVVGTVAVLAIDAWRVRAALASVAHGGTASVVEAFDGVA